MATEATQKKRMVVGGLRVCTWTWLVMLALTMVTWIIGRLGLGGLGVSLTVLAFALIKGQMIGDWFMGLRQVRGPWRWPVVVWLLLVGGTIATAFTLSA